MRVRTALILTVGVALAASCGGRSPTTPSTQPQPVNTVAAQTAVESAVAQAVAQATVLPPSGIMPPNPLTIACPHGGTMVMAMTITPREWPDMTSSMSSRVEFRDCKHATTTMNGDPYLEMAGETSMTSNGGVHTLSSTMRMTGGVQFETAGVPGRARYDCTMVSTSTYPPFEPPGRRFESSGTIIWEQPIGNPVVRPCGPG